MPTETMRVLVADDDAIVRCQLSVLLEEWGYEVVDAGNGTDAWALLQGPQARSPQRRRHRSW